MYPVVILEDRVLWATAKTHKVVVFKNQQGLISRPEAPNVTVFVKGRAKAARVYQGIPGFQTGRLTHPSSKYIKVLGCDPWCPNLQSASGLKESTKSKKWY